MTIQINPVDFRGFSLGGVGTPQLPNVGALGLQAAQMGMSEQASLRDTAIRQAQLRQADEMALRQNMLDRAKLAQQGQQFNKSLNLDKRKLGILEQQEKTDQLYKQQQLGLSQQQFGLAERELGFKEQQAQKQMAFEQMKMGVEQLSSQKKEDLNNIGAFAAQAQIALGQETDPTRANLLRNELTDQAVELGIVPKDQAKQLKRLSLSQFKQATGLLAFQAGKAKEIQALTKEQKGDVSFTVAPDGTVNYSSKPTTSNTSKLQEGISEADEGLTQVKKYLNPPDDYFGLASTKHSALTKGREMLKVIPGMEPSKEDKEKLKEFTEYNANAKLMIMKTAKAMAGSRFSDTDLAMIEQIMPQVGMGNTRPEYEAKSKMIEEFLTSLKQSKQKILSNGYSLGTPEYDDAMSNEIQSTIKSLKSSPEDPLGLR